MSVGRCLRWALVAFACGIPVLLPLGHANAQHLRTPPAVSPQPPAEALKPGLKVRYFNYKSYSLAEVTGIALGRPGTPGDAIATIDFPDLGPGAYVMGTRQSERVGAVITGFIKFESAGTHELAMVVNDMVQLSIAGYPLIEKDWDGTGSRRGKPAAVAIEKPGWHELQIVYYQRAGTAALQLLWKAPGQAGDFVIVPASAFAYLAD